MTTMLVQEAVFLLLWISWTDGLAEKTVNQGGDGIEGRKSEKQIDDEKQDVVFHNELSELYYESLLEPLEETDDVLVPIQRDELPIPLNDRAMKREVAGQQCKQFTTAAGEIGKPQRDNSFEDQHLIDVNRNEHKEIQRAPRNIIKYNEPKEVYPPIRCAKTSRQSLELTEYNGECMREPPFDFSWMRCDAEIQDWAYRRNPNQSGRKTRWNGVVHVAESPSFKEIIDGFWKEQSGAGFMAMYNMVKKSLDSKLEKREAFGDKEVETQIYSKWETLKDKVLEVRRDIRLRMIRKAEEGQLPKHGMIILREEELISEFDLDRF